MMYYLKDSHADLVVIRVSPNALDIADVMIADGNAARAFGTAFWGPIDGLERLAYELVYAEYWTDSDPYVQDEKKRIKCAEVLVPDAVPSQMILGAYVSCEAAAAALTLTPSALEITIDEHMFFRGPLKLRVQ